MPIIKDKYEAKGSQSRSKFVTRSESNPLKPLNTQQIQAQITNEIRDIKTPNILKEAVDGKKLTGYTLNTINTLSEIVQLSAGEYLSNIIISGLASDVTTIISLYWSASPLADINVSILNGIIQASKGSAITRILSCDFIRNATISLEGDGSLKDFGNFNKDVYIYALTNIAGQDFTIIKKSIG
jgi:hypothetical protein